MADLGRMLKIKKSVMKLKILLNNYLIQRAILKFLKSDLKALDFSQLKKINCFSFYGGELRDLRLEPCFFNLWNDFISLIDSLIIMQDYREIEDFNLGLVKSVSNSKSDNPHNYFANINLKNSNIKPRDLIYLFGFDTFQQEEKKDNWNLESCIKHFQKDKILDLTYYEWCDWYEWNNSDGSHHFAVALYHLRNNKEKYTTKVRIQTAKINQEVLKKLLQEYQIFMTHTSNIYKFNSLFEHILIKKHFHSFSLCSHKNFDLLVFRKQYISDFVLGILNKIHSKYLFNWNKELEKYLKSS